MKNKRTFRWARLMSLNVITPILLLISALFFAIMHYLAGAPWRSILFNADALYLPTLFSNLMTQSGSIHDWYLTPAPYFFPDYILFFFAYLLGSNIYNTIGIFFIIQGVFLFAIVWLLVNRLGNPEKTTVTSAAIVTGMLWLATRDKSFAYLFTSGHHFGVFLSSMLFVALWMQYENVRAYENKSGRWWLLGIAIIAFLSALSDTFFFIQVTIPFVVTHLLFPPSSNDSTSWVKRIPLVPLMSSIIGLIAYPLVVKNPTGRFPYPGFWKLPKAIVELANIFSQNLLENYAYGLIFIFYLVLVFHFAYKLYRQHEIASDEKSLAWFSIFSFLSMIFCLLSMLFLTNLSVTDRYLIPTFFFPIIIVFSYSAYQLGKYAFLAGFIFAALFVFMTATSAFHWVSKNGLSYDYYPEEVAYIDRALQEAELYSGIAQYWDAKFIQNWSKLDLNLAQYRSDLSQRRWITSGKYFREKYDFAIISEGATEPDKLSQEILSQVNGPPKQIVHCGKKSILIYGKDKLLVQKDH